MTSPYQLLAWVEQAQKRLEILKADVERQIGHENHHHDCPRSHLKLPVIDVIAPLQLIRSSIRD